MRVVGTLAGVITRQPIGTRDSQTGSDDFTVQPSGCWFLSGLWERSYYYHYKSNCLFVSSGSHSYYFTQWRLKQDHQHFSQPSLNCNNLSPESWKNFYTFNFIFWVDFGKINILDEVRRSEKWFPLSGAPGCRKECCRLITPAGVSHVWGSKERGNPFMGSKEEIHTLGIS